MRYALSSAFALVVASSAWTFPNLVALGLKPAFPNKQLVLALQDGTPDEQTKAAEAIRNAGPKALPMLPAILHAFKNTENSAVRQQFARALGALGPEAKDALPLLMQEFHNTPGMRAQSYADAIILITEASQPEVVRWYFTVATPTRTRPVSIHPVMEKNPNVVLPIMADLLVDPESRVALRVMRALKSAVLGDANTPSLVSKQTATVQRKLLTRLREYCANS